MPVEDLELLIFELSGVRYALPLREVREVVRAVWITPLPETPAVIEGAIDVRGELVPVYDLRLRFGLPARSLHSGERLIIAWTGSRVVAFRCDRTEWVESVAGSQVDSPATARAGDRHIAGVARLPDGLVLIQNLNAFLDEAEALELETALAGRSDSIAK